MKYHQTLSLTWEDTLGRSQAGRTSSSPDKVSVDDLRVTTLATDAGTFIAVSVTFVIERLKLRAFRNGSCRAVATKNIGQKILRISILRQRSDTKAGGTQAQGESLDLLDNRGIHTVRINRGRPTFQCILASSDTAI